jgi:hypothetical protein
MKTEEILSQCVILNNGKLYLGCCLPNFNDPVIKKVKVLKANGYEFILKEIGIFGEETYFCNKLNLQYQTDYRGDGTLHYSG